MVLSDLEHDPRAVLAKLLLSMLGWVYAGFMLVVQLSAGAAGVLMFQSRAVSSQWDTWAFIENGTYYAYYHGSSMPCACGTQGRSLRRRTPWCMDGPHRTWVRVFHVPPVRAGAWTKLQGPSTGPRTGVVVGGHSRLGPSQFTYITKTSARDFHAQTEPVPYSSLQQQTG